MSITVNKLTRLWPAITTLILLTSLTISIAVPIDSAEAESTRAADSITFAVIGDYGVDSPNVDEVATMINGWQPDFIVTTGDNRIGAKTYDQVVGQYFCDYLKDGAPGPFCSGGTAQTNAFFPALGNHDHTDDGGVNDYLSYFSLPGPGIATTGTSGNERYYDFTHGPIHFFAIDSHGGLIDSDDMATQKAWLQEQLAASASPWQIVYFHHPAYSSGSGHGSYTAMQWPFLEWGADAILSGHDHGYERLDIEGAPYYVNGAGGQNIRGFDSPVPGSVIRYGDNFGAMRVMASDEQIIFEFHSAGEDGLIDRHAIPETPVPADPASCYAIADDQSRFVSFDREDGTNFKDFGSTEVEAIEAIAWNLNADVLHAARGNRFGRIDTDSALFLTIGQSLGSGAGIETPADAGHDGNVNFESVKGLATDPVTGALYGAVRNETTEGAEAHDVLIKIIPDIGSHIDDAFGVGKDFVSINTDAIDAADHETALHRVEDIAVDPVDGELYAIAANGSGNERLIIVNNTTGEATDVGQLRDVGGNAVTDVRGLSFHNDGTLYASTGGAESGDRFWTVDKSTGIMDEQSWFISFSGYKALACKTVSANIITGRVYADLDASGDWDQTTDQPVSGAAVILYQDIDRNGVVEYGTDKVATATITEADGAYQLAIAVPGDFVVEVDSGTLPNLSLMMPGEYALRFSGFGRYTTGHDFGYRMATLLETWVDKAIAYPGEILSYGLYPHYPGPELLSNVVVSATVPLGTNFVPGSLTPDAEITTADDGTPAIVTWPLGSNNPAVDGFLAGQTDSTPSLTSQVRATPVLVGSGDAITVTLTAMADMAVNNVEAGQLITNQMNGVNLDISACSGPTLASADDNIAGENDPVVYQWSCTAEAGMPPDSEISFITSARGIVAESGGGAVWLLASSPSVLVAPTLSFQVQIDDSPGSIRIDSQAYLSDDNLLTVPVPGAETSTQVGMPSPGISGRVWLDENRNGIQEDGEDGIVGAVVALASNGLRLNRSETSGVDGAYRFSDLTAGGSYTVRIITDTLPDGMRVTYDEDSGTSDPDNETSIVLPNGTERLTADFGFAYSSSGKIFMPLIME